jgi:Ni,Fe-hydrogenase maturation factor
MGVDVVCVFGNEFLEDDCLAGDVAKHIDATIVHCTSPDDILLVEGNIVILDVAKGINEPVLITDVRQLKTRNMISLHDFDVGFFLNLLEELGEKKSITIIGIPMTGDPKEIAQRVEPWIRNSV